METKLFFQVAMAGLGKYRMGGCGRIRVYMVSYPDSLSEIRYPPLLSNQRL